MSSLKRKRKRKNPEEFLEKTFQVIEILGKIFQVTQINVSAVKKDKSLSLTKDLLEQILLERLMTDESPFKYLINCYQRANEEGDMLSLMKKDKDMQSLIEIVVKQSKYMIVSYCIIHLVNPEVCSEALLLPLIFWEVSTPIINGHGQCRVGLPAPAGFLEELFQHGDYSSLEPIMRRLYNDLRNSVVKVSAIGDFHTPLNALLLLISYPAGAKALVNHPRWIPDWNSVTGRVMEMDSLLGPFFHVSALTDHDDFKSEPDVGKECFPEPSEVRQSDDIFSTSNTITTVISNLQDGLTKVLLCLLKNTSTRKNVLEYLSQMINKNASRAHIKEVDPLSCASTGMFINLSAVMLRLCEPFLDAHLTKRNKIDPNYVIDNSHLDFSGLTALHASCEEVSEWTSKTKSNGNDSKTEYSFVCECFFMTARVLHLGLLNAFSHYHYISQYILRLEEDLLNMKAIYAQDPSPESQEAIVRIEGEITMLYREQLCYWAMIVKDEGLIQHALSFYRLMVVWLFDLLGGTKMPLPSSRPMEFAVIPEHFVEDAVDLLIYSTILAPGALDGVFLDDFMNFIVIFMASPQCIRNPHLRVKMVKVLIVWMPRKRGSPTTVALFESHQLANEHLVRNLLKFYVDVEFMGHGESYDKFVSCHHIAIVLKYLWTVPCHCNALKHVAKEDVKGVFFNFLNFLINDCIYLLDESFNKIIELKELEDEMFNKEKWEEKTSEERQERAIQFQSHERIIRLDMRLANGVVNILAFTSEQITAPFLLNDMVERVASMLNYFLLQLLGPQRKSLRLKEKDHEYRIYRTRFLKKILKMYVNLARGDEHDVFPAAIIKDGQSYNNKVFLVAAEFLRKIGEDASVIQVILDLGTKASVASSEATKAEEALGKIPDDFLDPIQCTLMRDPVILPASGKTVDRAVIQRHLLNANTDPFTRTTLTMEMLIPDSDLKSKIEEFIRSRGFE